MTKSATDLARAALCDPAGTVHATLREWELVIAQARAANVLGKLAYRLQSAALLDGVPQAPRRHLMAALAQARAQRDAVAREIEHLRDGLSKVDCAAILLKGGAYVAAQLSAGNGRTFNDVDILVPRERLAEVEAALMLHGWATTHLDAYDQRYYREWTHELPPMRHVRRGTTLDVHHAILPLTARLHPDSAKLIGAAQRIAGEPRFRVLAPVDMILHSATHLFFNEELSDGLRDLTDLDALLRDFGSSPDFWASLLARAAELDLRLPLHLALRYTTNILGTPVPKGIVDAAASAVRCSGRQRLLDALYARALKPIHPSAADAFTSPALWFLYVRGHWLRMPALLLFRHLAVKAFRASSPSAQTRTRRDAATRHR